MTQVCLYFLLINTLNSLFHSSYSFEIVSDSKLSFIKLTLIFSLELTRPLTEADFTCPLGHQTSIFTCPRAEFTSSCFKQFQAVDYIVEHHAQNDFNPGLMIFHFSHHLICLTLY